MMSRLIYAVSLLITGTWLCDSAPVADTHHSVVFSAGLTYTQHVAYRDTIMFDKVFTNLGSAYDKDSGNFVCPTPGLYLFHFNAYDMNTDMVMWLELVHNDKFVVSVSGYNSHSSGGNTVVLQLSRGDRVAVKAREQQEFTLFGLPDQIYSTFTGYLLVPTSGQAASAGTQSVVG